MDGTKAFYEGGKIYIVQYGFLYEADEGSNLIAAGCVESGWPADTPKRVLEAMGETSKDYDHPAHVYQAQRALIAAAKKLDQLTAVNRPTEVW
jgi:hypothetical protein